MVSLDNLRSQIGLHNHIAPRDLLKRFVCVQFLLGALWMDDRQIWAMALLGWLTILEMVLQVVMRTSPDLPHISWRRGAVYIALNFLLSIGYFMPGVLLCMSTDFGLYVGGLAWIMAAIATNLTMYFSIPIFYVATALPALPAAMHSVIMAFGRDIQAADGGSWFLPVIIMFLFVINSGMHMFEYRDTHEELATTRAELLRRQRQLEYTARHDALTGLSNRKGFDEVLARLLPRAGPNAQVAIVMIDLNGFKPINDTYGHDAGDAVLIETGQRLSAVLRQQDTAFRLGGDEFAVVCVAEDPDEVQTLGDRIAAAVREPIAWQSRSLRLGAAVGFGITPSADMTADDLWQQADKAMYIAKSKSMLRAAIFTPQMAEDGTSKISRRDVIEALEDGLIRAEYQPVHDLASGAVVTLVALAGWYHPERGVVAPRMFLPAIDEHGLWSEFTQHMLQQVLQDRMRLEAAGLSVGRFAVNMSDTILSSESARADLDWILGQHPGAEAVLTFEIRESIFVARSQKDIAASLAHYKSRGVRIAIDDFGSGFSSLTHLRDLDPDEVKINAKVADQLDDEDADQYFAGLVAIARAVGADITAEGIETDQQHRKLAELGFARAQGRLYADSLTPDALIDRFASAPRRETG